MAEKFTPEFIAEQRVKLSHSNYSRAIESTDNYTAALDEIEALKEKNEVLRKIMVDGLKMMDGESYKSLFETLKQGCEVQIVPISIRGDLYCLSCHTFIEADNGIWVTHNVACPHCGETYFYIRTSDEA